jgi:hypothetical protein
MRRVLIGLLLLTLLAAGCAGAEARRAQELLRDAESALAGARTLHYEADLAVEGPGVSGVVRLRGAAKRSRGGAYDQVLRVSTEMPGAPAFSGEIVVRGGTAWLRIDGRWLPAGSAGSPSTAGLERLGPDALAQLAPFIEDVSVEEGQIVAGRKAVVITCRIDTAGLLREAVRLDEAEAVPGLGAMLGELLDGLGDVDAVLVLDERTRMLRAARLTLALEADGQMVELRISLRVTGVDRPVRIPSPS